MSFELQFLGGAGTVTGSKYLLSYKGRRILIDCGLFQGIKSLRLKNWNGCPVEASSIDCVILTHAHIDHSGYIPRLIKKGFRGKIYSTAATRDVCKILLPDCGYLQEEEAEYLNKHGRTKHSPALPLFTMKEAEASLENFVEAPFDKEISIFDDLKFKFSYAGHILGAASVVVSVGAKKIAFTGDLGRLNDAIFYDPHTFPAVDYLVTESTYGNRRHENTDPLQEIANVITTTAQRGGVVVVPAFAVGRAQTLMYSIYKLRLQQRIPSIGLYLNSPMATAFGEVFKKYRELHKLSEVECEAIEKLFQYVKTVEDSKQLNEKKGPMVIISASGMLTGGRVLHHLKAFAPFAKNTILLTGFQSAGTRGEALQRGAKEVKVHGQYVSVQADVVTLDNMSAHADYAEMIELFKRSNIKPKRVFVTHGEASAADEFRRRLTEAFGWSCEVPEMGQKVMLGD